MKTYQLQVVIWRHRPELPNYIKGFLYVAYMMTTFNAIVSQSD